MSYSQTQLRFATSRSDGTVDLICKEDVVIPPHAGVSLTCEPDPSKIEITPENKTIEYNIWESDPNPRVMAAPLGILDNSKMSTWMQDITAGLNHDLVYNTDIGLSPTFYVNKDSKTELSVDRYYDIGATLDAAATIKRGITASVGTSDDFNRVVDAQIGESWLASKVAVPDGYSFVRCMVPEVTKDAGGNRTTGAMFVGFSFEGLDAKTVTKPPRNWGFGVYINELAGTVVYKGNTLGTTFALQQTDIVEVRKRGNQMMVAIYRDDLTMMKRPDFKFLPSDVSHVYALYDLTRGQHDPTKQRTVKVTNARFVCGDHSIDAGPKIFYMQHLCMSVSRTPFKNLRLKFSSPDLAKFLGFERTVYGPISGLTGYIQSEHHYAAFAQNGSILVTCQQPFNLSSYNLVDTGDAAPNGRVSILATVTPPSPKDAPIVWNAAPIWVPVHNRDKIMARRFIFRIMTGDFTPLVLKGETVLNVLMRASDECADGHPAAKRPHMM